MLVYGFFCPLAAKQTEGWGKRGEGGGGLELPDRNTQTGSEGDGEGQDVNAEGGGGGGGGGRQGSFTRVRMVISAPLSTRGFI